MFSFAYVRNALTVVDYLYSTMLSLSALLCGKFNSWPPSQCQIFVHLFTVQCSICFSGSVFAGETFVSLSSADNKQLSSMSDRLSELAYFVHLTGLFCTYDN